MKRRRKRGMSTVLDEDISMKFRDGFAWPPCDMVMSRPSFNAHYKKCLFANEERRHSEICSRICNLRERERREREKSNSQEREEILRRENRSNQVVFVSHPNVHIPASNSVLRAQWVREGRALSKGIQSGRGFPGGSM